MARQLGEHQKLIDECWARQEKHRLAMEEHRKLLAEEKGAEKELVERRDMGAVAHNAGSVEYRGRPTADP